jgi:DNA polymerase-3 subunit delta
MGKNNTPAFFVSYGLEPFFLDRYLQTAKNPPSKREVVQVSPKDSSAIVEACCCMTPGEKTFRIVIVDDAQEVKDDGSLEQYITEHDGNSSVQLVAIVRQKDLPKVWKLAAAKGKVRQYNKLKDWENKNEVIPWIEGEAKLLGMVVETKVAEKMFQVVGNDLYLLANELRKLRILVGDGGTVGWEHLGLVLTKVLPATPFQVTDAAFLKDPKRATSLLGHLYRQEGPGAHVQVVGSLMNRTETLLVARSLLDKGRSNEEIAARLDIHPWRCSKAIVPQARLHTVRALVGHMQRLCKLDSDVKGAGVSKRTLVELVVLSIAGLGAC